MSQDLPAAKKSRSSKKMSVHFSSKTDQWATPKDFYDELNKKYGPFLLDPCCDSTNQKCLYGFHKDHDGLTQSWQVCNTGPTRVFMNPPYGRGIGKWIQKAYDESQLGAFVVCLVPARTDTKWFHEYCAKGRVIFVKGRLKFGGSKNAAPFPSMVVIFEPPSMQVFHNEAIRE